MVIMEYIKKNIVDIALIAGVVTLSLNHCDGWGWLIFILIMKNI